MVPSRLPPIQIRRAFRLCDDWPIDAIVYQGGWSDFTNLQTGKAPQRRPDDTAETVIQRMFASLSRVSSEQGADFVLYTGVGLAPNTTHASLYGGSRPGLPDCSTLLLRFMGEVVDRHRISVQSRDCSGPLLFSPLPYYPWTVLGQDGTSFVKPAHIHGFARDTYHSLAIAQNLIVTRRFLLLDPEEKPWQGYSCAGAFHRESGAGLHGVSAHPSQVHTHFGQYCSARPGVKIEWGFQSYRVGDTARFNYPPDPSVSWEQYIVTTYDPWLDG